MLAFYENSKRYITCWKNFSLTFNSHLHSQVEIVYVLEGNMQVTVNAQTKNLQEGEAAIIFPNTVHSYKSEEENIVFLSVIDLDMLLDYSTTLVKNFAKTPFLQKEDVHPDIVKSLMVLQEENTQDIRLSKSYANIIVGRLLEKLDLSKNEDVSQSDLTMKILNYICENYKDNITLDILSKKIGASKYHISRIFSKRIGCSFSYYINSLRVGLAQHLLTYDKMSITDIAFECGFESQRSFNRAFKEVLELTPSEYKKTLNKLA